MATSVPIPIAEYLSTSYRPDREYIDGEIVERSMGQWQHARVQALLTIWFGQHEREWGVLAATEWRTQVASTRIRIPDVVLVRRGAQPAVLTSPPILIVEILSPGDSYADTQRRADDYLRMGVQAVWIIDPETRTGRVCSEENWLQASRLQVAGTPIFVDLANIFASLDDEQS